MNKHCQIKLQALIFPINLGRFFSIAKSPFLVREKDAGTVGQADNLVMDSYNESYLRRHSFPVYSNCC